MFESAVRKLERVRFVMFLLYMPQPEVNWTP